MRITLKLRYFIEQRRGSEPHDAVSGPIFSPEGASVWDQGLRARLPG